MRRVTFDLDVLRTFVTGMELGSFAKAAERLGRSTSAVSAQLKKLEEQAATPIFRKAGRGLALTEAGETMLGYARRLIELNDEAASAIRDVELEGWVRLGLQEDFGEAVLPEVLGRFARAHPKVRIEARIGRSHELAERVLSGSLDIALAWHDGTTLPYSRHVADVQARWIGPAKPVAAGHNGEALPLVVFEAPCLLRTVATETLDRAGLAWRMAFSSPSLGGIWAAVAAGLGLTIRTDIGLPANVRAIAPGALGLPALPKMALHLHQKDAELDPVAARLADILLQAALETLPEEARTGEGLREVAYILSDKQCRGSECPASRSVPPPSVLPDISPARGEIGCRLRFRQSPTLQDQRRRQSCRSPPLRRRWPAGQRGVLSRQRCEDFARDGG